MTKEQKSIYIKGARVHNLKNIEVEIPHNRLVVITGLSGSGKSTLAFDTIFAEGQRRYVESLSAYARQFLGKINKPDVDVITGIAPAIAIEQKVNSRNPRSTVGTSTEIYEYLRLLYARVGKTYSPVSGEEVKKHSIEDIVNCMLSYPEGTRYTVLTQIFLHDGRTLEQQLEIDQKQGFNRLEVNGEMVRIDEYAAGKDDVVYLLVDRMTVATTKDAVSRLTDSAETAMYEGNGMCMLRFYQPDGSTRLHTFSTKFEADGIIFEEPNDQMFSFNSPIGACPVCEGFGKVIGIDEHLVIRTKQADLLRYTPLQIKDVQPEKTGTSATLLLADVLGTTYRIKVDLRYDPILRNEDFIENLFEFANIRKKYPNISEANWLMLAKGEVKPGMTTEECKLAIGEPIEIRARTDSRFETWLYRGKILEFENGILLRAK